VRDQMAAGHIYWVKVATEADKAMAMLKSHPEVTEVTQVDGQMKVTLASHDTDPSFLAETLVRGGAKVTGLWEDELGLEEVFMRVTRGETQ
jgi:ABC-2 type transport system ATP-binding protein